MAQFCKGHQFKLVHEKIEAHREKKQALQLRQTLRLRAWVFCREQPKFFISATGFIELAKKYVINITKTSQNKIKGTV